MEQRQRADDDYVATQAALAQANEGKEQLQKKIRGIKDDARVEVETCRGYRLGGMSLKDLEVNDIFNYGNMLHTSHTGLLPVSYMRFLFTLVCFPESGASTRGGLRTCAIRQGLFFCCVHSNVCLFLRGH